MRRTIFLLLSLTLAVAVVPLSSGCQSAGDRKMSMASSSEEHPIACTACYDEIKSVRQEAVKGTRYELIRKHMCPDCKAETTVYAENGVMMFKCAKCAPDGVRCDKCVPAKAKSGT